MPKNVRGFVSKYDRDTHFDAHNAEFVPPFPSAEEYEAAAIAFLNRPVTGTIKGALRVKDGHVARYDTATNELAMCDATGAVTTYFKPDPAIHKQGDNLTYFRRRVLQ